MGTPEIAVVVPSHDRPLRLRWLLNALVEQTLARDSWEVIVVHDSAGPETEELLRTHPLAGAGVLRHLRLPGSTSPARKRNLGWRGVRAPLIAFTDDDCRPPREWMERALAAARRHSGAIVQGATGPDPEERRIAQHAPWIQTQWIKPPRPWAETCNIVYPRGVLETVGGFDESFPDAMAEDTDLAERARAAGVPYVGAPEVLTYHAVVEASLLGMVRAAWRWRDFPGVIRRYPRLRREYPMWMFWNRRHGWLPLAVVAWFLERRSRAYVLLAVPYLVHAAPKHHGPFPRGRIRALSEVPGRFVIDAAEILSLAWGSLKHRTLFL